MKELRLALLGSPQLFVDGEEKILRERKAVALLAYLAVEQTSQSRDTLATIFWPEHDQQRARANLRYLLWSLRKNVGEEWLATDGDQIALAGAGQVRVDVAEFRRHLDEWRAASSAAGSAHSHPADEFCAVCVESLETALQLYRGDFLQGFTLDDSPQFDDWQFFQAEGLRRELAGGLTALVELEIARQLYAAAIGHARRWLALDLLHEPASRALMKLYAWSGQYEAAIRQFHRCAQALQEEIGVEPDEETQQLYAQIRNRRFPLPTQEIPHTPANESEPPAIVSTTVGNLPPISTAFVGRQKELAQIAQRLADPSARLLTIVGPGGMGKSTLAVQAGRAEEAHFPDGIWFVPLAGMELPEQVPTAILTALAASAGAGNFARQQLFAYLRRKQTLLILDNFEDVLPAAEMLAELLSACPQVRLIITSRERLNLRDEWLLMLGNLTYPAGNKLGSAERNEYSALLLFEICAQRTQPAFVLDATNLSPVIRICQLVDGMPLALEMAAAWTRVLPVTEIPAEIEKSLAFLSTAARDVPERHRSIHAVFDHSWQLLTEQERSVLRQLSVFRNSFSREGAEAVAGASLLYLSALLDKSWLGLGDDGRYRMHGLAHQYALEKLYIGADVEADDVLQRHCFFFADLMPLAALFGEGRTFIVAAEVENVKQAWQTALKQHYWGSLAQIVNSIYVVMDYWGPRITVSEIERTIIQLDTDLQSIDAEDDEKRDAIETALTRFLYVAGEHYIHLGNLTHAIDSLSRGRSLLEKYWNTDHTANVVLAHTRAVLGFAFYYAGQLVKARIYIQEALTEFEVIGDKRGSATTHLLLALINDRLGHYEDAEKNLWSMTAIQEELSRWDPIRLGALGRVYVRQGRYQEADPILAEGYTRGAPRYKSHTLITLGAAERAIGNAAEAQELLLRGLVIAEEMGDRPAQTDLLAELGLTTIRLREVEEAQNYFRRSLTMAEEIRRIRNVPIALMGLGLVELMRGRLEKARDYFAQALTAEEEVQAPPDMLDILVSVGELYAAEGKWEAAIELLDLAARHPATTAETRTRALGLLQTLGAERSASESHLPMDAANLRLAEVARHTLAELKIQTIGPE